ncbi:acyl-CoA dehydrogenase family protein [bacterium]|nr:acyl-CoA dehydrogenase family protein [bacterium]MBU1600189.1 acyl-CoA dehydrogenase family protein [bacterium]MBU2461428.1 acyl-CoA dehydrogenase family protein [bacterium]
MDYGLTEEQKEIVKIARQIATERIRPKAMELDEKGEFPTEILKEIAQSDLFGLYIPEKYGGFGGGTLELCLATEEFSKACGGVAVSYAATALGAYPIILYGTEEQKLRYLPDIASGKTLAAFAITEPEAGSDASSVKTQATKDGDFYVLNGTKQWITNGGEAGVYTVIATTNKDKGARGLACFIVEKGTPGFSFGKKEDKLGIRCSATRELIFTDCRISKDNLIGKEGLGFIVAMRTFDNSRPGIAAQAIGMAQGALDLTIKYAKERVQFGQPISSFQGIQWMLADMATEIEAARALTYSLCRMIDSGIKDVGKESAQAKLFASDTAMKVVTDCLQIFGGYGYMRDYPIEKYFRDAKITQIYEGTNQIQRNIIGLKLIKGTSS